VSWLHHLDLALFRFINLKLSNQVFDALLPQCSSNAWFIPLLLVLAALLCWKGGARGRLLVLLLAVVIGLGDSFVVNPIKKHFERPRPYHEVTEANLLVGKGGRGSMPSSHTSTWFAATLIAACYYRRSWRFMLPLALTIGFSRVYLGVHYPTDVLAGALLGLLYAAAGLWLVDRFWQALGRRSFPLWWQQLPSLIQVRPVDVTRAPATLSAKACPEPADAARLRETQWMRLGYILIAVLLTARLWYVGSGRIELSEDEAYQWIWSKHLALSYYSKPPMIALLHWFGTALWGDTAFGIRFCPPVMSAALSLLMLHFVAREAGARIGFIMLLVANTAPLLAAGSILMTIDPPLVLFWSGAMVCAWRAMQADGRTWHWLAAGSWLGLAFLSKYTALLFIPSLALFFVLYPPARAQLRRPGPWLMFVPLLLSMLPVLIWNAQHGWVTVQHVSENAKLDKPWHFTLRFFFEFLGAEAGLLNPLYFAGMLVAAFGFWKSRRDTPLLTFLFAMGAPVFFGYWLYTLHSRVQPNWIAAGAIPLLCFTLLYWESRWRAGLKSASRWCGAGLLLGALAVIVLHETSLVRRVTGVSLPVSVDPLKRVRGIHDIARLVNETRSEWEEKEHRPTFIIASHYGLTGQMSFYLPEAKRGLPGQPLVFVRTSRVPKNQFYFWPEYRYPTTRGGQNAIYVSFNDKPEAPPKELAAEFDAITDLGLHEITLNGQVYHRLQLYACRNVHARYP